MIIYNYYVTYTFLSAFLSKLFNFTASLIFKYPPSILKVTGRNICQFCVASAEKVVCPKMCKGNKHGINISLRIA